MTQVLRQSTSVDVLIGPFLDVTDGKTAETGESPAVKLSKNGQTLAAKSDATTPVHDADGYYNCEFDATDTNTVGTLVLSVVGTASALPVRHEFQVIEEAVYDAIYAASAALAVGSVTGAVGSVTGAVGSVSGLDARLDAIDDELLVLDNLLDDLPFLGLGLISGSTAAGTLTTTAVTTDVTGYLDDSLIGRGILFLEGDNKGAARTITGYTESGGLIAFAELPSAPAEGAAFKIF